MKITDLFIIILICILVSCQSKTEKVSFSNEKFSLDRNICGKNIYLREIDSIFIYKDGFPLDYENNIGFELKTPNSILSSKYIFFKKSNFGYKWLNVINNEVSDTLPINFKNNTWYLIEGKLINGVNFKLYGFYTNCNFSKMKIYNSTPSPY